MQLRKIGVVLLALLLAAMAVVPYVSAATDETIGDQIGQASLIWQSEKKIDDTVNSGKASWDAIERNYVPVSVARIQANEELNEIVYLKKFGDGVNWTGTILVQDPLVVYDMNGKMLFYKFRVESDGVIVGEINVASSKVLGTPIRSVSTASIDSSSIEKMQLRADEIILSSYPDYTLLSQKIVLYDYPSTGLLSELSNDKTRDTITFVVDQNSYPDYRIVNSSDNLNSAIRADYSGNSRSIYDSLSTDDQDTNLEIWNNENGRINKIVQTISAVQKNSQSFSKQDEEYFVSALMTGKATTGTRELLRNGLYPTVYQGTGYDWCKIGTAHTITTYYYLVGELMDNGQSVPRSRTLQEIATKMGAQGSSAPTNPYMEQYYYQDPWSSNGLGMSQFLYLPYAPTLSYIVSQIHNGDPLKIGTQNAITTPFGTVSAGHARACYGYDTTGSQPVVYFSDSGIGTQGMLTYEVFVSSNYNTYIGKTSA